MSENNKFEQKLSRLEELSNSIRRQDISLEDALKYFEEGIKLARGMEKELEKMEGKIQILMNQPDTGEESDDAPQLELFSGEKL